jgi:hypothetical protein
MFQNIKQQLNVHHQECEARQESSLSTLDTKKPRQDVEVFFMLYTLLNQSLLFQEKITF